MRIVFFGTPEEAVPSLDALLEADHDVELVVTQPDRPAGRSSRPLAPPVKSRALARGLQIVQPRRVRDAAFRDAIAGPCPDVLVVVAFGRILPPPILEAASYGAVNVHFSLLPAYRGAAPVQWALARGERVTGVTTMLLNERMDEGDVLLRRETPIGPDERAPELKGRLAAMGADLLVETLQGLEAGTVRPSPQDHERATYAPLLRREDGEWDPAWTASEVAARVRGFDPWPGVWARRGRHRIRIVDASPVERRPTETPPGEVVGVEDDRLLVACAEGSVLAVAWVQPEGRRPITARDAVNGRQIAPGDRLERPAPAA